MSFTVIVSDDLKKKLTILKRRDHTTYVSLQKKMLQIIACDRTTIEHFKNLRGHLSDFKRVHIGNSVLIFRVADETIFFEAFDHHDKIYKKIS